MWAVETPELALSSIISLFSLVKRNISSGINFLVEGNLSQKGFKNDTLLKASHECTAAKKSLTNIHIYPTFPL